VELTGANVLMGVEGRRLDGHAHVFECNLPMAPGRRYSPDNDALLSTYVSLLNAHGLGGGLLVQPSFLGADNSYLLAALNVGNTRLPRDAASGLPPVFRGVVTLEPDTSAETVAQMNAAGVVGMRFNLFGKSASYRFDIEPWRGLISHINRLGWHVDLHCEGALLASVLPELTRYATSVVIDHFGLPDPVDPLTCAGLRAIEMAPRDRVFVKTSAPYRVFRDVSPELAAQMCSPVFRRLHDCLGPTRLLWGSDWPWTQFEATNDFAVARSWEMMWVRSLKEQGLHRSTGTGHRDVLPGTIRS